MEDKTGLVIREQSLSYPRQPALPLRLCLCYLLINGWRRKGKNEEFRVTGSIVKSLRNHEGLEYWPETEGLNNLLFVFVGMTEYKVGKFEGESMEKLMTSTQWFA